MKNIAILMGGFSQEAAVSLQSAATVAEYLDKSKYTAYRILITKENGYIPTPLVKKFR